MIDDHPAMLQGIEFMLSTPEDRARLVGASSNMAEAMVKIPTLDVQVILLDLFISHDHPVSNLKDLKSVWPGIPVIIFSAENSAWWKQTMFSSGANAFLDKISDNEMIINTILRVADGSVLLPAELKHLVIPEHSPANATMLTRDELEIGKLMSAGLSIKEIAANLSKSPSLIEKQLRFMRMKTDSHSNPELIRVLIARQLVPIA